MTFSNGSTVISEFPRETQQFVLRVLSRYRTGELLFLPRVNIYLRATHRYSGELQKQPFGKQTQYYRDYRRQ